MDAAAEKEGGLWQHPPPGWVIEGVRKWMRGLGLRAFVRDQIG